MAVAPPGADADGLDGGAGTRHAMSAGWRRTLSSPALVEGSPGAAPDGLGDAAGMRRVTSAADGLDEVTGRADESSSDSRRGVRRRSSFEMGRTMLDAEQCADVGDGLAAQPSLAASPHRRDSILRRARAQTRPRRASISDLLTRSFHHVDAFTGDVLEAVSRFMMHPRSPLRRVWSRTMLVALAFETLVLPFRVAFVGAHSPTPAELALYVLIDVIFVLEVPFNFATGVIDADGEVDLDPAHVARMYTRTWLFMDVLIAFPFDTLQAMNPAVSDAEGFAEAKLIRLLRIVRVSMSSSDHLGDIASGWWLSARSSFRLIVRFAALMLVAAHINACVFWYIGEQDGLCDGSWVSTQFARGEPLCEASRTTQYITALYWSVMTMSTTGYGNISATTGVEQAYCAGTMLFGSLAYFYFVLQVCDMIANNNIASVWRERHLDNVQELLTHYSATRDLRMRINEFYAFRRNAMSDVHGERQLLSSLPQTLMKGVWAHASETLRGALENVSLFTEVAADPVNGEAWLVAISSLLRPQVHPPNDVIVHQGARGNSMYFVQRGRLVALAGTVDERGFLTNVEKVDEIGPHGFFGEKELLAEGRWPATVRAVTYALLYSLSQRSLQVGMREHPEVLARIREVALATALVPEAPEQRVREGEAALVGIPHVASSGALSTVSSLGDATYGSTSGDGALASSLKRSNSMVGLESEVSYAVAEAGSSADLGGEDDSDDVASIVLDRHQGKSDDDGFGTVSDDGVGDGELDLHDAGQMSAAAAGIGSLDD